MKTFTRVFLGLLLILIGALYILKITGIADVTVCLNGWWTFFIIIPCFNGVLKNRDRFGNMIGLAVGILLFLAAQGVFGYVVAGKLIVPVIIILVGLKMVIVSQPRNYYAPKESIHNKCVHGQNDEYVSAFAARNMKFDEDFQFAKVGAIFGAAKCDLTNAKISDGSRIELMCAFGGVEIVVPEDVNVNIHSFCAFGAVNDKREMKNRNSDAPTLYIDGFCILGGADIVE